MNFTELFIRRPVLATVMSLILILVGLVTWDRLQLRQYPRIEEPKISVTTQLEGASPDIIEVQITKLLEDALSGIEGVDTMKSSSEIENSRITMTFKLDTNIEAAANNVRDRIARIRNKLPRDISDPRIKKADADAVPILYLALSSDRHTPAEIADYAKRYLESPLEAVKGVSSVDITGGGEKEMILTLDPIRMNSYGITAEDVASALKQQNVEKPAGELIAKDRQVIVTTLSPLKTEADFNKLIIGERNGYLVRLADVGSAKIESEDKRFRSRYNDKNSITIGIIKQSVANSLDIKTRIVKMLPDFRQALPKGMFIDIAYDKTIFIERSLKEVRRTILEATGLVILVVLLSLGSWRAALVPIVTIPVSLIGTFSIMYAMGYSINVLTLLAMVLAIGLVVDDAIVMLENIYRYIEEGMKPMQAAIKGAKEISFPVIAMTLTLAAVYAPIGLSTGLVGRLFSEFSITLASAVLISGFVALTLSPTMCARILKPHDESFKAKMKEGNIFAKFFQYIENGLVRLSESYGRLLHKLLNTRMLVLLAGLGISLIGVIIGFNMKSELAPREDRGVVNTRAIGPFGATLEFTDKYMKQVDEIVKQVPEVERRLNLVQVPGESNTLNLLTNWENRERTSHEIADSLRDKLQEIIGLQVSASSGGRGLVSGVNDQPVQLVIQTTKPYEELMKMAAKVQSSIGRHPNIQYLQGDFGIEGQQYVVTPDPEKARISGVDVLTIGETLDTLVSGRIASHFKLESKRLGVRVQVGDPDRRSPEDFSKFFIRGRVDNKEVMVPLSELITVEKKTTPTEIRHFSGLRSVTFFADLKSKAGLGDTLKELKAIALEKLPPGARVEFDGESRRFLEEQQNIYLIYAMAVAFIFLVLAAQYESFIDPLIILFSVPLSIASGIIFLSIFGLWSAGGTINLYSQIGFVTLIGLITKHAILIVDFANKLKEEGVPKYDAVIEASKMRLRPILMTTFAMVIGAFPLAFAGGAGAEGRQAIGAVIVGGMSMGTVFTLFVVPAVYTYLSRNLSEQEISEAKIANG